MRPVSIVVFATLCVLVFPASRVDAQAAAASTFAEARRDAASEDDVRLRLTAGGTLAYGNARTFGLNVAGAFVIRRSAEQLDVEAGYLFGLAETPLTCAADPMGVGCGGMASGTRTAGFGAWTENANNATWRVRYDHYLGPSDAIFVAHRGRRDPFAGLDARLGVQLGYSRVLLREENHRLALDLGVDGTIDLYTGAVVSQLRASPPSFPALQGTDGRLVPAVRAYLAYENRIHAALTYETGLEVLWNVVNPAHLRFDWQNHVRSSINDWLQLGLDVTVRFDAAPPGQTTPWQDNPSIRGVDGVLRAQQVTTMFDLLTTLNLVGNLDLDGTAPAPAEEEEACPEPQPCPVCETTAAETAPAETSAPEGSPAPAPAPVPAQP